MGTFLYWTLLGFCHAFVFFFGSCLLMGEDTTLMGNGQVCFAFFLCVWCIFPFIVNYFKTTIKYFSEIMLWSISSVHKWEVIKIAGYCICVQHWWFDFLLIYLTASLYIAVWDLSLSHTFHLAVFSFSFIPATYSAIFLSTCNLLFLNALTSITLFVVFYLPSFVDHTFFFCLHAVHVFRSCALTGSW